MVKDLVADRLDATEAMLYAWGDETRSRADELGLPRTSGIARLIEQQRIHEGRVAGRRRKRRKLLRRGIEIRACRKCEHEYRATLFQCPRCGVVDVRAVERELRRELGAFTVHGSTTRSMRAPVPEFSSRTAIVEAVVLSAPGWMQKVLRRRFLFVQRDDAAAQQLRMRKTRYKEELRAAVEYVAARLAGPSC